MEEPYNGPGKPTHHRADGTNYVMLKGDEYHNIWPVYDWQKISGTTILQKPKLPGPSQIQKDGLTDFVGAVTDGTIGAVAFDFISPHDKIEARKAWFFFEDDYACLGTAIHSDRDLPVVTTVNQVLLRSGVTISKDNRVQQVPRGKRQLDGVKWVHHDKIGYLFPEPATVHLSNQTEQGRWSDITDEKNVSDELVSKDVFTLWIDHGHQPRHAGYQYIVVPDVSVRELQETADKNHHIDILSNTADIQAVRHRILGACQIAFYKAGALDISEDFTVTSDSPGMVMLTLQGGRIDRVTVSDPSRKLSEMRITVSGLYDANGEYFAANRNSAQKTTSIEVDLPRGVYAGKSRVIEL
jgi:chondroitin AC lyase